MDIPASTPRPIPMVPLGLGPVARPLHTDVDAPDYDNVLACIRCGLCLSVCPTYNTTHLEVQSPRGRVALIRAVEEERLPKDSPGFKEHLYNCLDCRACETICPSGVKVGQLVLSARAEIDHEEPQPWLERFLKRIVLQWVMVRPERVEWAMKPLRLYQRLGLQKLVRASGVLRRLPGRFSVLGVMEDLLPRAAQPTATKRVGRSYPVTRGI